jgi:hypothetical protein
MKLYEVIRENMGRHTQDGFKAKSIKMGKGMVQHLEHELAEFNTAMFKDKFSDETILFGMKVIIDESIPKNEFRIIASR